MPICIGKATRLIEYLKDDKAYIGTVQLGKSTTTYDLEGEVVEISDKTPSLEEIEAELNNFRGDIEQLPPIFSAIKVKGKKLYEYARKGEEVEIQPRSVNISELELLNYDKENRTLELYIKCSKGTYIRSIAHDLGKNLNCFGHLIKLVRVKAGDFLVENAIKLDELSSVEEVEKHLIYPLEKLDYQTYELNEKELELVSHGMQIGGQNLLEEGIVILTHNSKLVAVAEANENKIKCLKVFI